MIVLKDDCAMTVRLSVWQETLTLPLSFDTYRVQCPFTMYLWFHGWNTMYCWMTTAVNTLWLWPCDLWCHLHIGKDPFLPCVYGCMTADLSKGHKFHWIVYLKKTFAVVLFNNISYSCINGKLWMDFSWLSFVSDLACLIVWEFDNYYNHKTLAGRGVSKVLG